MGFVALVGIPLNGPMLLRSLYSDFSIGCLDSPERCAVTPSLSIHAIMCLSSRWWCPGPDDDSLVETNTHTLIIDFTAQRRCNESSEDGYRTVIQISCGESVLAFDSTILL